MESQSQCRFEKNSDHFRTFNYIITCYTKQSNILIIALKSFIIVKVMKVNLCLVSSETARIFGNIVYYVLGLIQLYFLTCIAQ